MLIDLFGNSYVKSYSFWLFDTGSIIYSTSVQKLLYKRTGKQGGRWTDVNKGLLQGWQIGKHVILNAAVWMWLRTPRGKGQLTLPMSGDLIAQDITILSFTYFHSFQKVSFMVWLSVCLLGFLVATQVIFL